MKICWFGIYDYGYSRNKILIDGLRDNGVTVTECNYTGTGVSKYISLYKKLRSLNNEYDYLYCAFPVHVTIVIAFLFQRKPIVVDAFFSKYEAVIVDRKAYSKYHPKAFLYFVLDAIMIFSANLIIVDTQEHKEFFSKWRDPHKIHIVPVGVHTGEFFPILQQPLPNECFLVQFHGSYIPLQGIEHIVEAARILSNEKNIQFRFIGNGQEYLRIRDLVARYSLNIEFLPWLSIAELNTKLNEADAILGIFGDTEKTDRVIPNKIYQGLAVRKAVLSKDTVAIREQFTSDHLLLCKNSAESIAESIKTLCDNKFLRDHLADSGYHKIIDNFTQKQIGLTLMHILLKQST